MSIEIITNKSANPYYVEPNPDPDALEKVVYAERASRIVVYTGLVTSANQNLTIVGSGTNAALKMVAAGDNEDVSNAGDYSVTLTNLRISSVYGGAVATYKNRLAKKYYEDVSATYAGNTNITIENGRYSKVYGGGGGYGSVVTGDTTVNYDGGNVSYIYGGGDTGSVVEGNTYINIYGNPAGGRISRIYGGGYNSTVEGSTNVTFYSDAALIRFSGTVDGGGRGRNSIVGDERNLTFADYSGDFKGRIKNFTNIIFQGGTSVTLTKTLDRSLTSATYEFVITDETLSNINAMLTVNSKRSLSYLNNIVVSIESEEMLTNGSEVSLIASRYFKYEDSFNADKILVLNDEGEQVSDFIYTINYEYDRRAGGEVSIEYDGSNLVVDKTLNKKVVLTGIGEELNIVDGGQLNAGANTAGGDDIVNIQSGAVVNGSLNTGAGDDMVYVQAGSEVNGTIELGGGANTLNIQTEAMVSGVITSTDGSTNYININGGAASSFDSGDSTTTNVIVVNGTSENGGGIGYWASSYWGQGDFYTTNLVLGDSMDTVTFNRYAEVNSILLGGGNDTLIINDGAEIGGNINLGTGNDLLVLNTAFSGTLIANEGENVIVTGTDMTLNGDFLNLGSTNNVLVVSNGTQLTLSGSSIGNFLAVSENDGIYLDQNATVTIDDVKFIQNYSGELNASQDVYVIAPTDTVPEQIAPYYNPLTDGVADSSIVVKGADFTLGYGAKIADSYVLADNIDVFGTGSGTTLVGDTVNFYNSEADSFSGAAAAAEVNFYTDFSGALAVSATALNLMEGTVVTIDSFEADNLNLGNNAILIATATDTLTVQNITEDIDFGAFGVLNIYIDGTVGADASFTDNTVTFSNNGKLAGNILLNGANTFVIAADSFMDWQQLTLNDGATLGFDLADNSLLAIDGLIGADPITVVDETSFGQNSRLAIGEWVYIQDWNGSFTLADMTNTFDQGTVVVSLDWNNLHVSAGAEIWGSIVLDDDTARSITIEDNVLINGDTALYDYAAIVTGTGADTLDIGAATVNGTINTADGDDTLALTGTDINAAVNQGVPVIDMGAGDDALTMLGGASVSGDIALGDGEDSFTAIDSEINGGLSLGDGADVAAISGSIIDGIINAGDGEDIVTVEASQITGGITLGDGADQLTVTDSTVNGDIDAGDGADTVSIIDAIATVNGDLILGDGSNEALISNSVINGSVIGGSDSDKISITNSSTISNDILTGLGGEDVISAGDGSVGGSVVMMADTNTIGVQGSFTVDEDILQTSEVFNAIVLDYLDEDVDPMGGTRALNVGGDVVMSGPSNFMSANYFAVGVDEDMSIEAINNTLTANSVQQLGANNFLSWGLGAETDGEYEPGVHRQSAITFEQVDMVLTAPVVQYSSELGSNNYMEAGPGLFADGEGDITLNGAINTSVAGGISQSGYNNKVFAGITLVALNQGEIHGNGQDINVVINGDINQTTDVLLAEGGYELLAGINTVKLGYQAITSEAGSEDGAILDPGTYTTTINGNVIQTGIDASNYLYILQDVIINGTILMGIDNTEGKLFGDQPSAYNELNVSDPGSIQGNNIIMVADENLVNLEGSGDLNDMVNIYGGTNTLTVGSGVTINDDISFGSVFDADQIGTEGYLILQNTANTVNIAGTVNGDINTMIDLGAAPLGYVNSSADTITVTGTVNGNILTGDGDDIVNVLGGTVSGNITMGSLLDNPVGTNQLNVGSVLDLVDPELSTGASVNANVVMNSDSLNGLVIGGAIDAEENTFEAKIGGDVTMSAFDADGILGANTLDMGVVSTITGNVSMEAGAENTVTVNTGWIKDYSGGPLEGQYDATAKVNSLAMQADSNVLNVNTGELIITEAYAAGVNGITMINNQRDVSVNPTNAITIADTGRLVMETGVSMGNMTETLPSGVYNYTDVMLNGDSVEVFYYNYSETPAEDVFDTYQNLITVNGKMYTGNVEESSDVSTYGSIDMIGEFNGISVIGPADTDGTVGPYNPDDTTGAFAATTSVLATGLVGMHGGDSNDIIVYADNPGEAAWISSDIVMDGMATGDFTLADMNAINTTNSYFFSGSITQRGQSVNTIFVTGVTLPGGGPDGQDLIVESEVDGFVNMYLLDGNGNDATFATTDINGDIDMQTAIYGYNSLSVSGAAVSRVTDGINDQILLQPTQVYKSTVDGSVTMSAAGSGNTLVLGIADVNGDVSMTSMSEFGYNLLGSNGFTQAAYTAVDPSTGLEIMIEDAIINANVIDGAISMITGGNNDLELSITDVAGSITMTAGNFNFLTSTGFTGFAPVVSNDPDTGLPILLAGSNVRNNNIGGAIEMTAGTGNNTATLTATDVNGAFTQTTAYGSNSLTSTGTYVAPVTGLSIVPPAVSVEEYLVQDAIVEVNLIDGDVSQTAADGGNTANLTLTNVTGGLSMNAEGSNTAQISTSDIGADIAMTAVTGSNSLELAGDIIPEVTYSSGDVQPEIDLTVNVGGGVTMVAEIDNNASIEIADITGGVTMTAATGSNTVSSILDSAIGGDFTMTAGADNTITKMTDSIISGNLSMTAVTGGNSATIDPSYIGDGTGTAVSMSALLDNTLDVSGDSVAAVLTPTTPDPAVDQEIEAGTNTVSKSMLYGNVSMESTEGSNTASFDITDVTGGVTMEAGLDNYLSVAGVDMPEVLAEAGFQNEGDILAAAQLVQSTIGGDVTQTSDAGDNSITLDKAVINGDIAQNTNDIDDARQNSLQSVGIDGGSNEINGDIAQASLYSGTDTVLLNRMVLDLTDVNGNINQSAQYGSDDPLVADQLQTINDLEITDGSVGNITQSTANGTNVLDIQDSTAGVVTMTSTNGYNSLNIDPSSVGNIDMTAGATNTLTALGAFIPAELTPATPDASTDDAIAAGTNEVEKTILGDIDMTAGNINSIDMEMVNAGAITMEAGYYNKLSVDGYDQAAVYARSGSQNDGTELAAAELVTSNISGAVSQTSNYTGIDDTFAINGTDFYGVNAGTNSFSQTSHWGEDGGADQTFEVNVATLESSTVGAVTQTASNGTNKLNIIDSSTGAVVMTATSGYNDLSIDPSIVGSVSMTAALGNTAEITDSTVAGITVSGGAADLDLNGSIVTGSITTGAGNDLINLSSSSAVNVSTGSGDDTLTFDATSIISGTIDMGTGTDTVTVGKATFDVSDISWAGDITINGNGGTEFTADSSFGVASQSTTVDNATELAFVGTTGAALDVNGSLDTDSVLNILDASGLASGDSLLDAADVSDWDVLDSGVSLEIYGNDALANGESITLADSYNVDLAAWYDSGSGVTDIQLSIDGGSNFITLSWDTVDLRYESGTGAAGDWALETIADSGNDELTLAKLA